MAKTEVNTAVKDEPLPIVKPGAILGWNEAEFAEGECMECGLDPCRCDQAWMNTDRWEVLGL
jgi:hypothetical protein